MKSILKNLFLMKLGLFATIIESDYRLVGDIYVTYMFETFVVYEDYSNEIELQFMSYEGV